MTCFVFEKRKKIRRVLLDSFFKVMITTLPSAKELEASSFVESLDQSLSTLSSSWSSLLYKES